ncbi:MAG: hypothetical protein FJX80_01975 [Bacteroidetes bacterium]|nr:hypothetical protein [Bacteroidota bacterium]
MALPKNVQQAINKQSGKLLKNNFERIARIKFEQIKTQMIKEFLNHPVTNEIKMGPQAQNISNTLGGYGNLFSYIGFYDGEDPIAPLLAEFEKSTIVFSRFVDGGVVWNIYTPAKEDMWEASPMPWAEGRSWAKGIETGISGLGEYFYTLRGGLQNSRSETAIQVKSKLRGKSRFKNVKYITSILNKYEKKFSQLDEASIST